MELFLEFLENLLKIPMEFLALLRNPWNSDGGNSIGKILELLDDENFLLFSPHKIPGKFLEF
jgi:hypothetical protein